MRRTTIMAEDELLDAARRVAQREGVSLAEIIRQGIELRVRQRPRRPSFIGAVASGDGPHDTAERAEEIIEQMARDGRL